MGVAESFDPVSFFGHNSWFNAPSSPGARDLGLNSEFMKTKFQSRTAAYKDSVRAAREFVYGPIGLLFTLGTCGTLGSILCYGRIMPPLPDLTLGEHWE